MAIELEVELIWCYCCEEFTNHEVYKQGDVPTIYQCDCGCQVIEGDDEIVRPSNEK